MKARVNNVKNIALLIGVSLLIASCCSSSGTQTEPNSVRHYQLKEKPDVFTFQGHEYIRFWFSPQQGGVVHSPNCHCHNLNKTNDE